jgi:type VI secretion system protein ImpL
MSYHSDQLKYAVGISALVSFYGIVSMLVWLIGPSLGISESYRIIMIGLLLLTWPFAMLINRYRKRREEKKEGKQAAAAPAQAAPAVGYDELTRSAEEAVKWLHSTKLGVTETGDSVYSLPWFLLAGPTGSGKTSLALASGLDFHALPSQRSAELNLIRPTRDCEWRVTNSAVLLDTTGRYQTEGQDKDEWSSLIEMVKRYRKERPIDGIVIAVNAAELIGSSEADIEQKAKILRARLDETISRVKIRFPVYLVFSHIDSIEGFQDFFQTFSYSERSQVWGVTIPLDQSANAHALFDVEFDYLYDALVRHRLVRLGTPAESAEQLRVFDFPLYFGDVRSRLGLFTSALFRPNPFSENPLFRGFYFTASPAAVSENGAQMAGESYFTEHLFKDVLLRDGKLAASFLAGKKHPERLPTILAVTAASLLILFTIGAIISFALNRRLISEALDRGARVDEISRMDSGANPVKREPAAARVELESTESLREMVARLDEYDRNSRPLSLRFGIYSGNSINPYVRTIYFDSVSQRFYKPVVFSLERDLKAFAEGQQVSGDDLGRYYDLLKVYLMLSEPKKAEPTFLANQMAEYWKKSSPQDMEMVSQQQLEFLAKQAGREDAPHTKADDKLVAEVRQKLSAYPAINRYYKRITTEIDAKVHPVTLEAVLQGQGRGWIAGSYSVPGSFTLEGYHNYMRAAIESAAEEMSKEDWVMGSAETTKYQSADSGKLQSIYFREYTAQWQKFLKGISIQPFKTKEDAVEALKVLTATNSPMVLIMDEVARNTNLSVAPSGSGIIGWVKGLFKGGKGDAGGNTEVEKEFHPLFQFVAAQGKEDTSPISQYRATLRPLLEALESASADQLSQTSRLLLTGKDDIGLQKTELGVSKQLDTFKTAAARDASAVLKQPLGNVRAMLYGGGYEQIERGWSEQIYPKAHALESGFPFTDYGGASVTDLSKFLNPVNGQFTAFFNDKLTSSFEDAQGQWKLKESGAFKFSDSYVKYLNGTRRLREALFPAGGQQPEVGYEITLQAVAGTDLLIEIDGNRVETRGTSPQSAKFIWPARAGASGAKISVIRGSESAEKTFPGEWGLFKMFAAGGASKSGENLYSLSWNVGNVPVRATLRPSSATSPFERSLFTQLHAPQSPRE